MSDDENQPTGEDRTVQLTGSELHDLRESAQLQALSRADVERDRASQDIPEGATPPRGIDRATLAQLEASEPADSTKSIDRSSLVDLIRSEAKEAKGEESMQRFGVMKRKSVRGTPVSGSPALPSGRTSGHTPQLPKLAPKAPSRSLPPIEEHSEPTTAVPRSLIEKLMEQSDVTEEPAVDFDLGDVDGIDDDMKTLQRDVSRDDSGVPIFAKHAASASQEMLQAETNPRRLAPEFALPDDEDADDFADFDLGLSTPKARTWEPEEQDPAGMTFDELQAETVDVAALSQREIADRPEMSHHVPTVERAPLSEPQPEPALPMTFGHANEEAMTVERSSISLDEVPLVAGVAAAEPSPVAQAHIDEATQSHEALPVGESSAQRPAHHKARYGVLVGVLVGIVLLMMLAAGLRSAGML